MTQEKKPERNDPYMKPSEGPKASAAPKTVGGHQPAGAKPAADSGEPAAKSTKHEAQPSGPAKK